MGDIFPIMDSEAPLVQTAMEVLARATTSSSVLSFNLTGVVILVILKIAIIAYTLLNTNDLGLSLFGARSLNTLSTRPGYSHSDLTGAMCFLPFSQKYSGLLDSLEMSNKVGTEGGDCSQFS